MEYKSPFHEIVNMSVVTEIRDTSKIKIFFLIKFENTKPKTYPLEDHLYGLSKILVRIKYFLLYTKPLPTGFRGLFQSGKTVRV